MFDEEAGYLILHQVISCFWACGISREMVWKAREDVILGSSLEVVVWELHQTLADRKSCSTQCKLTINMTKSPAPLSDQPPLRDTCISYEC